MFRRYPRGRAASRRAFVNAGLVAACTAAAMIAMPAAAADAAVPAPFVSTATSVSAGAAVTDGTMLTVTFGATPVLAGAYSLTLTDGSDVGRLSSTAGNLTAAVTGSSIVFTVHGAPSMSVGSGLSLSVPLEILQSTGVSDGSGDGWDLVASGQVVVDASNNCSTIGLTRVFAGSNCDIGFVDTGPMAPGVFDVIPLPTQDLPGPPDDNAPEVVTNCAPGSTDWVYDVNTEAQLGSKPCGTATNPPEQDSEHREHELGHARLHPDTEPRVVRGGRRDRVDPRLELRQRHLRAAAAERDQRQRRPGDVQLLGQRRLRKATAATRTRCRSSPT